MTQKITDRELLEFAAKAAGIELGEDRIDSGVSITGPDGRHRHLPRWNPLADDGDALRLAVNLHIDIASYKESGNVHAYSKQLLDYGTDGAPSYQDHEIMTEPFGDDQMAATRRAIVRAAASIGEQLCRT